MAKIDRLVFSFNFSFMVRETTIKREVYTEKGIMSIITNNLDLLITDEEFIFAYHRFSTYQFKTDHFRLGCVDVE